MIELSAAVDEVEYPLVYLRWVDSSSYSRANWHPISEHDVSAEEIYSTGFIVDESDDFLTLAMSISVGGNMLGDITIPKLAIRENLRVSSSA